MDSINSRQLRLSLQQHIQTSIHEKSIKSSIKSVKSVTRDKTLESVEIKRSITENKDPVGDIEIDEGTDSDADIRKEVYSSQGCFILFFCLRIPNNFLIARSYSITHLVCSSKGKHHFLGIHGIH